MSKFSEFNNKYTMTAFHVVVSICASVIFFTYFIVFVMEGMDDAISLAWIAFAATIMHEEEHWWRKRRGADKIAVAHIHMCKCYVDENKDCGIGCGDERENRKEFSDISEGKVKKGGVNSKPTTTPPSGSPKSQGGSDG